MWKGQLPKQIRKCQFPLLTEILWVMQSMFLIPSTYTRTWYLKICVEKSNGIKFYQNSLHTLSTVEVDSIKHEYGPNKRQYLSRFQYIEQYYAYSRLKQHIQKIQGYEGQIFFSFRNKIRGVQPQAILKIIVDVQRTGLI